MTKSPNSPEKPDRVLLEFAPLIYVAWSDGLLTEEESARIRMRVAEKGVTPAVKRVLDEWLNPARPPTPARLYALLDTMRAESGKTKRRFRTLVEFGRFLGRSGRDDEAGDATPELRALKDVEEALGISDADALRKILGAQQEYRNAALTLEPEELMHFVEGERYDIRRYVFGVLQRPAFDRSGIDDVAVYRRRTLEWCRELARLGVSSYGFPRSVDGEDNIPKAIAAFESIAYFDLSLLIKFGVHFGLFGGSILQLGTRKHHEAYLPGVANLELPGCFAMTETGHGSNVRDIETTASYDVRTREFVIDSPARSAWKDYIGNAAQHARMATVFAQLEVNGEQHGVHAFLVPLRDADGTVLPGIHVEDCGKKVGLNGVDNGRIAFDGVRIPRDHLLDRFGGVSAEGKYSSPIPSRSKRFFTMLGTLVAGRISIAAAACSATRLGLCIATRYAMRRTQFGPEDGAEVAILHYRSIQRRLLPLIARTYALDFAIHDTTRLFARLPDDTRTIELRVAALKAAASAHAVDGLHYARELCAGQGYLWQNRIGELRADTDIFTTFEGANNVLLQLVAKGLLTELREDFEEARVWKALKQVGARAGTAVTESNPVMTRKTDDEHLRDPEFHADALQYREDRLLRSVAARLRALIGDGRDPFEAVNDCQDHLIKLAEAHTDRIVLESFQNRIERAQPAIQQLLTPLCGLYALATIDADRAWYLESGYFEPVKSRAIRALVNTLCAELHESAGVLVDAWGIPQAFLPEISR